MLEKPIKDMFNHKGKTVNIIGKSRIKSYQELYDYIEDLQRNKEVDTHANYLGDNVLARNIYEKKYFLKDIDANLIESCPEDVFKRLSSFLATVEGTKAKQKKWAQKYYEQLFEGYFILCFFAITTVITSLDLHKVIRELISSSLIGNKL